MGGGGGRGKGMDPRVESEKGKATESFLRSILTPHRREEERREEKREETRDEREGNASQTGGEYLEICCT